MHILIYSYNYYPEPIGIAPLMTELAEGLVEQGHEIRVITGMPNYPEREVYEGYRHKWYVTEKRNGVTIQRCFLRIKSKPNLVDRLLLELSFVFSSLPQALNGWRPDVIFVTVPPLFVTLPGFFLGRLYGCPVVLNVQDILTEAAENVGLIQNKLMIRALSELEKFAYKNAHSISVIADCFVDSLVKKGVDASKIVRISNWVNVNFIRPLPKLNNSFRVTHKLEDKFVVLYSGNIALTQDLETAIASAALLKDIPEIMFAIVGETKALEELRKCCRKYNTNNVLLSPLQPREELPQMLAAADVGLVLQKRNVVCFNMPSKIPLLLASGCPIIASVPSTGTAATQSGGGIIVAPESPSLLAAAILDLYHHPAKAAELGKKGRKFAVDKYAFEDAIAQYETLFTDAKFLRNADANAKQVDDLKIIPKLISEASGK
jgi:colanic acid biosynthesis glycosyl transferase WcaI